MANLQTQISPAGFSLGSKLRNVTTLRDPGVMDELAEEVAERPDADCG
jgi:hypothetical protein